MQLYDIIFILTIPIYLASLYRLNVSLLGERMYSKRLEIGSYCLYAVGLIIVFLFLRMPVVLLIFNLFAFFFISLNYYGSALNRVAITFSIYIFLFIVEILITVLTGYLNIDSIEKSAYNSVIGIVFARVFMLLLAYLISKFKSAKTKNLPVPIYYYAAHVFILLGTLYLFLGSLEVPILSTGKVLINSIVLLVVNGVVIFVDERIYDIIVLNSERNLLKQQNIAYENQTEIVNHSLTAIRTLRHDMNNHVSAMRCLYEKGQFGEFESYTEKILQEINGSKALSHSENFILDSILNLKLGELEGMDTDIKLDINTPQDLRISAFDLTVILGNLLDNAVTALKEAVGEKKLDLCIHCTKGSLVILINNSYGGRLNEKNGKLKTTKAFAKNHEIGLESVQRTVSGLNGDLEINYTSSMFSVAILIPIRNE